MMEQLNGRKIVAYYRASTQKQVDLGYSLEMQQFKVTEAAKASNASIIAEYSEVASGRKNNRSELHKALAHCKREDAMLVVSSIDRLSRKVGFISALMESKTEFFALDAPQINAFNIHILAAMAEREADLIRERTKAGLAVAKARGTKLGAPKGRKLKSQAYENSAISRKREAEAWKEANAVTVALAKSLKEQGLSLAKIAEKLNAAGAKTPKGGSYRGPQVTRLFN